MSHHRSITNTTSTTRPNSNHRNHQIIDPTSVQRQFHALVEDKKKLTSILQTANAERKIEEQTLQQLRSTHHALIERTRIASSNLGSQRKKQSMLRDEQARLRHTLAVDRQALEAYSEELTQLECTNVRKKYQFVKEMDGINDEMVDTLRQIHEMKLEHILTLPVVKFLEQCLVQKVDKMMRMRMRMNGHNDENDSGGGDDSSGNGNGDYNGNGVGADQKKQWANALSSFQGAREKMARGMEQLAQEKETYRALEKKALELRSAVQRQNTEALGEAELDELEHLWEQSYEIMDNHGHGDAEEGEGSKGHNDHGHHRLHENENQVYGVDIDIDPEADADADPATNGNGHGHGQGDIDKMYTTTTNNNSSNQNYMDIEQQQQQQPTNMSLFYGNGGAEGGYTTTAATATTMDVDVSFQ